MAYDIEQANKKKSGENLASKVRLFSDGHARIPAD